MQEVTLKHLHWKKEKDSKKIKKLKNYNYHSPNSWLDNGT
jgi:hypothetical protein